MFAASRRISFYLKLIFFCFTALPAVQADLVWDAELGWYAEGGLISPYLATPEGKTAKILMDKARRAEQVNRPGAALKAYKRVIKKYPGSLFAPEALHRSAKLYEETRKYTKAFRNLQRVVKEHPAYKNFNEVLSSQYRIAEKLANGARPLYFGLIPGFRQREKGLEFYEQVIVNAPYSDYAPLALMNAAQAYTRTDNRDAAIDALDRMINNYPESFLTSDAYLKLAATQASITQGPPYDQASTQLALTYFQDYLILYPGESDAAIAAQGFTSSRAMLAESKMTMGDFYYKKRSNYRAAKVFYNEAITLHPDSTTSERARRYLTTIDKIESGIESGSHGPRTGPRSKRFWFF
jgi:outer membrane protein assembly factor BamD